MVGSKAEARSSIPQGASACALLLSAQTGQPAAECQRALQRPFALRLAIDRQETGIRACLQVIPTPPIPFQDGESGGCAAIYLPVSPLRGGLADRGRYVVLIPRPPSHQWPVSKLKDAEAPCL